MSRLSAGEVVRLHGLHWASRIVLRVCGPLRAKAVIDRLGGHLLVLHGADDARAAVEELLPSGSCLSRALAVAATLPGAEVVIGVDPWSAARMSAHAWLEVENTQVETSPGAGGRPLDELARLPAHRTIASQSQEGRLSSPSVRVE